MNKSERDALVKRFGGKPVAMRTLRVTPDTYNSDESSVEAVIATELEAEVWDWARFDIIREVLRMDGMMLPDGRSQVPLLDTHSRYSVKDQLGSVKGFRDDTVESYAAKLARFHFDSTDESQKAATKVREGHVTDNSVGYEVMQSTWVQPKTKTTINGRVYEGGERGLRVTTAWKLKEVSLCPIGADELAMIRSEAQGPAASEMQSRIDEAVERALKARDKPEQQEAEPNKSTTINTNTRGGVEPMTDEEKKQQAEQERLANIKAVAEKFKGRISTDNLERMTKDAIDSGVDEAAFRLDVYKEAGRDGKPLETPRSYLDMPQQDVKRFSISRMILGLMNIREGVGDPWKKAGAEHEQSVLQELEKRGVSGTQGTPLPYDVMLAPLAPMTEGMLRSLNAMGISTRDMVVGTASAGGYTVATQLFPTMIEYLTNRLVLPALGATFFRGLRDNIAIPRDTADFGMSWVAENNAVGQSDLVLDQVTMSPKSVGRYAVIGRKLLVQNAVGIDAYVQRKLLNKLALEIQRIAIHGLGSSNEPRGILATSGIGAVVGGTDGATPAWSHIVKLITEVEQDNADGNSMAYLTNAKVKGTLMQTEKAQSTNGVFIWPEGRNPDGMATLAGYRAAVTNAVSSSLTKGSSTDCSAIIHGNWESLIIGEWGNPELIVNPYSLDTQGAWRITLLDEIDVAVEHPESFAAMTDAKTL